MWTFCDISIKSLILDFHIGPQNKKSTISRINAQKSHNFKKIMSKKSKIWTTWDISTIKSLILDSYFGSQNKKSTILRK